jgi:Peptidase M15
VKTRRRERVALLAAGLALLMAFARPAAAFDSGRAAFSVIVNNELVIPYRVFAVYVLPGERLRLLAGGASAKADAGTLEPAAAGAWDWTAPATPGVAVLTFEAADDRIRINAVILHPASTLRNGRLNGYTIGSYPAPLHGDPVYRPPVGYIELTAANADLALSPHFRLDQFPSKQSANMPKYLALREALFLKLELLLEHVNEKGIATDSFVVMSGFRTPVYNHAIGNVQSSRHIYGGAADIFVDVAPEDGVMDDLNGDGKLDYRDAQYLYRLADELFSRPANRRLRGGLGVYRSTPAHGPFLHVDARGARARWGLLP